MVNNLLIRLLCFTRNVPKSLCLFGRAVRRSHVKRAEIDRRLAGGEPASQIASAYGLNPSSLYRHRANRLKLASANAIKKEIARGTAAAALLPSKETLSGQYRSLCERIDVCLLTQQHRCAFVSSWLRLTSNGSRMVRRFINAYPESTIILPFPVPC
jgi:hypothetical protein